VLVIEAHKITIEWSDPEPITDTTALSNKQLAAHANKSGVYAYSPSAGEHLSVGTHALSVVFTPDGILLRFFPQTKLVSLVVRASAEIPRTASAPRKNDGGHAPDAFSKGLLLDANIGPGMYGDGIDVYGISWKDYYTEVQIELHDVSPAPLDNIDITIEPDTYIVRVVQVTDNPCVHIEDPVSRSSYGFTNSSRHYLTKTTFDWVKSYRVTCNQLLQDRIIRLLVAVTDLGDVGGTPTKDDPEFVTVTGSYETSPVDGLKRYPIKWTHRFAPIVPADSRDVEITKLRAFEQSGAELSNAVGSFWERRARYRRWTDTTGEYLDKELGHSYRVKFQAQMWFPPAHSTVRRDALLESIQARRLALSKIIQELQHRH